MPKEASNHFGSKLYPFVEEIVNSNIEDPWTRQVEQLPGEVSNAILTSHGNLTPNYAYIAEIRKINEAQEAKRLTEEFNKKALKRNMSLLTVSMQGHLFDTQCFNKTIDACESEGVQFRVLKWDLGLTGKLGSKVAIQLMAHDKEALNTTLDKIEEIAQECNVDLMGGEDPEYGHEGMMFEDIIDIEKN